MSDDFVASQPLEYERSIAVFVCLAVAAVVLSVPFGFVRWNLSTLAPLVWWQLGLSTALGTAAAGPLVYACTLPAIRSRVNFPVMARASFGVRGAKIADAGRGILGLVLFTLVTALCILQMLIGVLTQTPMASQSGPLAGKGRNFTFAYRCLRIPHNFSRFAFMI